MRMYFTLALLAFVALLGAVEPYFMTDPAISPDGNTVCFDYMNDLWTVPFAGGEARRITVTEAREDGPVWSPDGKFIAFMSNRDGRNNIWVVPAEGGPARQVCWEEVSVLDWFADGKHMLAYGRFTPADKGYYRVDVNTGEVEEIVAFADVYSTLTNNDKSIVFARRGDPYREKYQGSDNGELWRYDIASGAFSQLTHTRFTERYPVASRQQDAIYYAASDGERFQLYRAVNGDFAHPEQLSHFDVWSARDLSIARANDRLVFEYFDQIGTWDPATGKTAVIPIDIKQDYLASFVEKETLRNRVDDFDVAPNGKFIVFAAKYDLFAMPAEGGEVRQITHDQSGINSIAIMDDNRTIYFVKMDEGVPRLFKTDITALEDIELVSWSKNRYIDYIDSAPQGLLLIFFSEGEKRYRMAIKDGDKIDLVVDDIVASGEELDETGEWIIYNTINPAQDTYKILMHNRHTGESHTILGSEDWLSGPGFGTDRRTAFFTKNGDIYRIDLVAKPDDYQKTDPWDDVLAAVAEDEDDEEADEEKEDEAEEDEGLVIDWEGISDRVEHIIGDPGNSYVAHAIDDSTFYYVNDFNDEKTLRKAKYDGSEAEDICSFSADMRFFIWNPGNKCFYYTVHGQLYQLDPNKKRPEVVSYQTRYNYDRLRLNEDILRQVWVTFGHGFYDPAMHGLDWNAVWKRYGAYADKLYTTGMLGMVVDEMIGDVNASHTGFYPRTESHGPQYPLAQIGARFDWKNRPARGIKIESVYTQSKLAQPGGIKAGDVLLSVDGVEITRDTAVLPLFIDKVDEEIELVFDTGEKEPVTVKMDGISFWNLYDMWYHDWTAERARKTEELSNGRIGYLHIRGMDNPSYEQFLDDLFYENADKEALIIDIRHNGGGWTHDKLLEALTKKKYGYRTVRGLYQELSPTPAQRWEKPIVLLINEGSFSDAEIFPILFKELNLGKIVGMPTPGGVIGTGHEEFMDGSSMRMPSNGWYNADGVNMEGTGAKPDIEVDLTPEQIINDDDVQLKTAVEVLLQEL